MRDGAGFAIVDAPTLVDPEFHGLGHGLIGTAPDYLRFLRMLLRGGELDGRRLLAEATVAELLANQIGARRLGVLPSFQPAASADVDFRLGAALDLEPPRPAQRGRDPRPPRRRRPGLGRRPQHPLLARPSAAAGRGC